MGQLISSINADGEDYPEKVGAGIPPSIIRTMEIAMNALQDADYDVIHRIWAPQITGGGAANQLDDHDDNTEEGRLSHGAFSDMLKCLANCCAVKDLVSDIERWTQSEVKDFGLSYFFDRINSKPFIRLR